MKTNWFKKAIVYQIYPFSYMDKNNDGMGDIKGIISKLDYIKELGVNAIWFSPLYESPLKDYGYDISDYLKINPIFGTNEDFINLIKECHDRNIKVIMDMVLNHTSNKHKWFIDAISNENSKYRNYYIIRKGIRKGKRLLPPSNWTSTFTGSAWENIKGTDDFYLHLFTKEQPDLNWDNDEVRNEIYKILNHYLDLGVDGFRFDVFNVFSKRSLESDKSLFFKGAKYYIDGPRMHEFLKEMNKKSLSLYDSYTVGESFNPSEENALKYVDNRNSELDSIFTFAHLMTDSILGIKYIPKKYNFKKYKTGLIDPQIKYHDHGYSTLVLENHDQPRIVSRFGFDQKYRYEVSTMMALSTYLGFGIPYIYQGQEIGMTNSKFNSIDEMKDPVSHFVYKIMKKIPILNHFALKFISSGARDNARVPMQWDDSINAGFNKGAEPWMKVNPNYKEINVKSDLKNKKSIYKFYKKVLEFKFNNEALVSGTVTEIDHNNKNLLIYKRELDNDKFLIIANYKNKVVKYKLNNEFKDYKNVLSNYDDLIIAGDTIYLNPYQGAVLKNE